MYKKEKIRLLGYCYCDCIRNAYKSIKSRIVFRVVTGHFVSHTKSKYAEAKFSGQSRASWLPNPQKAPEHFTDNIERK